MKKIIVFMIFAGLMTCSSLLAQSLIGSWQLQNPGQRQISQKFIITENTVESTVTDLITQEFKSYKYASRIDGNLIILIDASGKESATEIIWINKNKFKVIADNTEVIYGRCGTWSDRFMANYIAAGIVDAINEYQVNNPVVTTPQSNSASVSAPQTDTVCRACLGTGQCPVCHGSRRVSYYGNSKACTDCSDGKCFHCHGTRKQ